MASAVIRGTVLSHFLLPLRCEKGFFPAEGEGLSSRGLRAGSSPAGAAAAVLAVSPLRVSGPRREPALGALPGRHPSSSVVPQLLDSLLGRQFPTGTRES